MVLLCSLYVRRVVKSPKNSDLAMNINKIYVEVCENVQGYVIECCKSESHGQIDGFILVVANTGGVTITSKP
jgi:hypothetical protein